MTIPKLSLILGALLLAQSALAATTPTTYQFQVSSQGLTSLVAPVDPPPDINHPFEGTSMISGGAKVGPAYGTGIYYSEKVVSSGVAYFEVQVASGVNQGDSFFGFTEANHLVPNNSSYYNLNGNWRNGDGGGGTFDINTFGDKTEFSMYAVRTITGGYNGPANIGISANFNTHTIKLYYNNVLKYTLNNLPANIQLRAVKSWNGSGVVKLDKASWTYNPEGL